MLETICLSLPQENLFPNLRKIDWGHGEEWMSSYIPLFLGPNITDVDIVFRDSPPNIFLPVLTSMLRYPDLTKLGIAIPGDNALFCRSVSKLILSLNQIEEISLTALDRVGLHHLAQLPTLRSLCLIDQELRDLEAPLPSTNPIQHYPFPALRTLNLFDTTLECAIEFCNLLSDCRLDSFLSVTRSW